MKLIMTNMGKLQCESLRNIIFLSSPVMKLFLYFFSSDGESHPGTTDPPAGAGEGERPVQGLL